MAGTAASRGSWTKASPARSAIEVTGQEHANHAGPVGDRSRSEESVDGRPEPVLLGPPDHLYVAGPQLKVGVGGRDVDPPFDDPIAVNRVPGAQGPAAGEQLRQAVLGAGAGVHGHEDGGGQLGGQRRHEARERVDPPFRRAHHDDVSTVPRSGLIQAGRLHQPPT
jgi:hypothetical protein